MTCLQSSRQFLMFATGLLTVLAGPYFFTPDEDAPLAILVGELCEDAGDENDGEDLLVRDVAPVVQPNFHFFSLSDETTFVDLPMDRGRHNKRGPPPV